MINILREKILSWTPELANGMYNQVPRIGNLGGMIYEKTNTGWFLYSAEKAAYYDLNGESFILQTLSVGLEESLNAQEAYALYAETHNLVRIEKPVEIEHVSIYGLQYLYHKTVRPYSTHGISQLNMAYVSEDQKLNAALELSKINFKKMDELFQLIDACEGTLYPKELNTENLYYDPATDNYFWAGDLVFNKSRQESIDAHVLMIPNLNYYISNVIGKQANLQSAINNYVNTECSILQLP